MSGGEQQRVAIARALANKPALVLADEPTGELDSLTAASIFQLLQDVIREEGVTIITTTHDRLVMEKAQRVLELADGVLQDGAPTFERDRREAVAVALPADAEVTRDEPPEREAEPTPPSGANGGRRLPATNTGVGRRPAAAPVEPPAPDDGPEDDRLRWARPGSRERQIYEPPGPPREPL
jgi:ABC-type glutathione transport system ATPase component